MLIDRLTILLILMALVIFSLTFYAGQISRNNYGKIKKVTPAGASSAPTRIKKGVNNPIIFFLDMKPPPRMKCPFKCDWHTKASVLNRADAIVFGIPNKDLKRQRKDQIWIFSFMESPHNKNYIHFPNDHLYNWTMTFRRDSDIPQFYGHYYPKKDTIITVTPQLFENMSNHKLEIDPQKLAYLMSKYDKKTKLIGWASSRKTCSSPSRREILVDKLAQLVTVDRYGSCGTHKCKIDRFSPKFRSCYAQLGEEYKFYLSFENSLCVDYVTEKFFSALANHMIPIVYGEGDYKYFAPPGSYINALSFQSVQDLADYIMELDRRPEEYFKYFLWKEFYNIEEWQDPKRFCALCQKLWSISITNEQGQRVLDPNYFKTIRNISTWWAFRPPPFSSVGSDGGNDFDLEGLEPACRREPPIIN